MAEEKHAGGRPLKFQSVEELQGKIDTYFADCDKGDIPYTITGLALELDTTRRTLIDYEEKDEFTHTIKRAKLRVENSYELSLRKSGKAGDIFGLKNFGWKDKTEQDVNMNASVETVILDKEEYKQVIKEMLEEDDC